MERLFLWTWGYHRALEAKPNMAIFDDILRKMNNDTLIAQFLVDGVCRTKARPTTLANDHWPSKLTQEETLYGLSTVQICVHQWTPKYVGL